MVSAGTRTVRQVIKHVLPPGCYVFSDPPTEQDADAAWDIAPHWPPDLFAVAGHLLRLSGAYSYILPPNAVASLKGQTRLVSLEAAEIVTWREVGADWREEVGAPDTVQKLWTELLSLGGERLFVRPSGKNPIAPRWWKIAFALFVIADEASEHIGYVGIDDDVEEGPFFAQYAYDFHLELLEEYKKSSPVGHTRVSDLPATVGINADPDIVCVQPKSRVGAVGCSLRTLSHNLALLPPRGVAAVNWNRPTFDLPPEGDQQPLHILLIPYPYALHRAWFKELAAPSDEHPGWLDLLKDDPKPLGASIDVENFVIALALEANSETNPIHGVVLPEDAVTWPEYEAIARRLAQELRSIEFFIAGASTNCNDDEGSHVLITSFGPPPPNSTVKSMTSTSRSKHHRWQLDTNQAAWYGLTASSASFCSSSPWGKSSFHDHGEYWWETIPLPHRMIHTHVI